MASETSSYEFTAEQNRAVSALTRSMRASAVPIAVFGGLEILIGVWLVVSRRPAWGQALPLLALVAGAAAVAIVVYLYRAAASLDLVVETEGSDVHHLMRGLVQFKTAIFSGLVIAWVVIIGMFGGIVHKLASFAVGGPS